MASETSDGPTPNGGVSSEIIYSDDNGNPVEKAQATQAEIREYDAQGKVINRTYGKIRPQI
jgi:hypothetical protein